MIISHIFLKFLYNAFKWDLRIAGYLYTYDEKKGHFQVIQHKSAQRGYILRWLILMTVAASFMVRLAKTHNAKTKASGENVGSLVERSLTFMGVGIFLFAAERYRVRGLYPAELTRFLNAAIQLEKSCSQDAGVILKSSAKFKLAIAIIHLSYFSCKYIIVPCVPLASAFKPSFPLNAVWIIGYILPDCKQKLFGLLSQIFKFWFTLIGNGFIWDMILSQGYSVTAEVLTGTLSLNFIQRVLRGRMQKLISEFTLDGSIWMTALSKEMVSYRAFQITVERFNQASRTTIIGFLVASGGCEIVLGYMLISQASQSSSMTSFEISPFMYAFFLTGAINACIICLGIYGYAGDIHHDSVETLESMKKLGKKQMLSDRRQRKYLETVLGSCPPERIRFGAVNFIEKTTPLVFQMFCLNRLVDLLLLRGRRQI